jgi:hypothetical protein
MKRGGLRLISRGCPNYCGPVGALSRRCRRGTFPFMERFVIRLPEKRRRELDALAAECGLSAADVARLGIGWVLRNPDALPGVVRREANQSNCAVEAA